ncbi:unnamed protein product [Prunus armeniaca]
MTTALRGRRGTKSSEIKRVKELEAKEFMGSTDPAEAECWISDVERIFEVLECPDGDRVCLATFLLKGNAYHWWKAVKSDYENPVAITWEEFHMVQTLWWEIQEVVTANTYPNMRALAQAAERVSRRCAMGAGRRRRDAPVFGQEDGDLVLAVGDPVLIQHGPSIQSSSLPLAQLGLPPSRPG